MSQTKKVKVTCSKCGAENEALIWDSINTGINPEQKQNVINGPTFMNTCHECREKDRLNYNTLYHDTQNNVKIYVVEVELLPETSDGENSNAWTVFLPIGLCL